MRVSILLFLLVSFIFIGRQSLAAEKEIHAKSCSGRGVAWIPVFNDTKFHSLPMNKLLYLGFSSYVSASQGMSWKTLRLLGILEIHYYYYWMAQASVQTKMGYPYKKGRSAGGKKDFNDFYDTFLYFIDIWRWTCACPCWER